jgi:hypothetical protein
MNTPSTIPPQVYDCIKNASFVCHWAELKVGKKNYSLQNKDGQVVCTLFIKCREDELKLYEEAGYETSTYNHPKAWKRYPLWAIPLSNEEDWDYGDEY